MMDEGVWVWALVFLSALISVSALVALAEFAKGWKPDLLVRKADLLARKADGLLLSALFAWNRFTRGREPEIPGYTVAREDRVDITFPVLHHEPPGRGEFVDSERRKT